MWFRNPLWSLAEIDSTENNPEPSIHLLQLAYEEEQKDKLVSVSSLKCLFSFVAICANVASVKVFASVYGI